MRRPRRTWQAGVTAAKVIRDHRVEELPVDPISLARRVGIEVIEKPREAKGVSGMLIRVGNEFSIVYATHVNNVGFQNFSVAHELGHYFLQGHSDAVLDGTGIHQSRAGFVSDDRYEREADCFAAHLLMPPKLFSAAMRTAGDGLQVITRLAGVCRTSLTATAIRVVQLCPDPMAIVISRAATVDFCFLSDALMEVDGLNWIRKGSRLNADTTTLGFNQDRDRIRRAERVEGESDLRDWFGGELSVQVKEEIVGLGRTGKTLTVLTAEDLLEKLEQTREEEKLREAWRPKFRL